MLIVPLLLLIHSLLLLVLQELVCPLSNLEFLDRLMVVFGAVIEVL